MNAVLYTRRKERRDRMNTLDDPLDESIDRLAMKTRTRTCLRTLYGADTTIREIITIPLPNLTDDVRKRHARPGIVINDLAEALRDKGWLLGSDPLSLTPSSKRRRELQYLSAYPGITRRESARMILWLTLREPCATAQPGWGLEDQTEALVAFESLQPGDECGSILRSTISGQKWKRLDGNPDAVVIDNDTTIKDILDAYFISV